MLVGATPAPREALLRWQADLDASAVERMLVVSARLAERESDRMADEEWRPTPVARGAAVVAILGSVLLAAWLVVTASVRSAPAVGDAVAVAAFLAMAVVAWRVGLYPRITASTTGLDVVNPIGRTFIAWNHVTSCSPGYWGLVIERTDDLPVTAWAAQQAHVSSLTGRPTRAGRIADRIIERAALSPSSA